MEEARTLVLDLLGQKPWDEGPGAVEDAGGHLWVGSEPRGLRQAKKGDSRGFHTRSRIFSPGPPPASCLLSSSFPHIPISKP